MEKQDKIIMIVGLVAAALLLYMIKPEQALSFCVDWNNNLYDRFESLDDRLNENTSKELGDAWIGLQREQIMLIVACSDISIFF